MTPDEILAIHDHRPWPLPPRPWVMRMDWRRLLFAHWPVPAEKLRPLVPSMLELDLREDRCWVAVTPFFIDGIRVRGGLPMPSFPELNVRTYVRYGEKPGVYFFSLDVTSWAAMMGARLLYGLPYFHAYMRMRVSAEAVHYVSSTKHQGRPAEFEADYAACGPAAAAAPGSLEQFLVERYCLYAVRGGHVYRAEIHHAPWKLQPARATIPTNTVARASGIELPEEAPLLHYSHLAETLVWWPERMS